MVRYSAEKPVPFSPLIPGNSSWVTAPVYQTIVQFMREDGRFHSAHRDSIETLLRHLHQEVGRYENHKFYVLPRKGVKAVPHIEFVYTGKSAIAA